MIPGLAATRRALRRTARAPGWSAAVVATLALGIGAVTAIYAVVDGVALRPLPLPGSERLVVVCETAERVRDFCVASPPNVAEWERAARSFSDLGWARDWPFTLGSGSARDEVHGGIATPGFFRALEVGPLLGRLLGEPDLAPGGPVVAVLDEGLWRRRFGADPAIVGRTITLDDRPATVVGVLAAASPVPRPAGVELWVSPNAITDDLANRDWRGFLALGRLAPGATLAGARREMSGLRDRLETAYPESLRGWGIEVHRLRDWIAGPVRPVLFALLAAVGLLWLIAGVNVANLLLAEASRRETELAVRAALGARPARLARQLLGETLALALAGGALGLLLAEWGVLAFRRLAPPGLPRAGAVALDGRVLLFALALTTLAALAFGAAPALRAGRGDLRRALYGTRGAGGSGGLRGALVVAEIALALLLLAGAGLALRGFARLASWDPGIDLDRLIPVWMTASPGKVARGLDAVERFERVAAEVAALPGVESTALASAGPLFGGIETVELAPAGGGTAATSARWFDVGPGFFATLGVRFAAGRDLAPADSEASAPVAVVNRALAARLWPGADALGRRVTIGDTTREIVGVVEGVPPLRPDAPPPLEIYWPKRQDPRWGTYLLLRVAPGAGALERAVRARIAAVDPDLSVGGFVPLSESLGRRLVEPRATSLLVAGFAAVALLLAALGTAAVVAYEVAARRREIGVRLALGASPRRIELEVVARGLRMAALGAALGLAGAIAAGALLGGLLYGVPPADPPALAAAVALLGLTAIAACWIPARSASRVDPSAALRAD